MTLYWFKPKSYGYGATPVTWQGWALVLFHVAVLVGFIMSLAVGEITVTRVAVGALMVLLVSIFVVWLSVIKTDGPWAWRWGTRNKS